MKLNKLFCLLIFVLLCVQVFSQPAPPSANQAPTLSDYVAAPETHDIYFSFVQFSDMHIDVNDERGINDLRSAVDEVNVMPHVAFVLVSGDLTDRGDYESMVQAKRLLDKLEVPYYVVPGNNDTENLLQSVSTDKNFKRVFRENRFRIQFNGFLFLGLNTAPVKTYGEGHVAPQDIVWVERQLKNVGKKLPVFIITHHPMKTGDVDNWFMLTDVVRKYNVQSFIGGHYHRNMINNYDGIPGILCRSTLSNSDINGGYTLYYMTDDSLFVFEKRIGEPAEKWLSFAIEHKFYVESDVKEFPKPDYSVNDRYKKVKEAWVRQMGYTVYSAPTVNGEFVYIGDDKGVMHCLSLSKGKEIWTYRATDRIVNRAMVKDNNLLFESEDGFVYCLDLETGKAKWRKKSSDIENEYTVKKDYSEVAEYDGIAVTTTKNGDIVCSETGTGVVLWQHKIGNSSIGGVAAVSPNEWVVSTTDGAVVKLTVK